MIQQLILLTDSVQYAKRVSFQIPGHLSRMKVEDPNEKLSDFASKFLTHCSYFGMINKQLIALDLDEEVFMNCFSASEKNQELVLCIDDTIVVSKSAFFTHRTVIPESDPTKEQARLPINSINLIAITNKYENVETVKQLISFFVSVLVMEQNYAGSLAQQLTQIDRSKDLFVAGIKQLAAKLQLEQQEIGGGLLQAYLNGIRQRAEQSTANIPLFFALKNLFECANNGTEFEYFETREQKQLKEQKKHKQQKQQREEKQQKQHTQLRINPSLKCTQLEEEPDLLHKTLLFTKRKARQQLGQGFTQRFDFVATAIDARPNKSLQEVGIECKISQSELKNTAKILLANNIAISSFPIMHWNRYSICLTKKHCATQFKNEYQTSYIQTLKSIEKSGQLDNIGMVLFLLMNGIIRQSKMYVFVHRKTTHSHNPIRPILAKYSLTGKSLLDIIRLENLELKQLFNCLSDRTNEVDTYMTE